MKENKKNYYWQETNRENYLKRLDRKNKLSYFSELVTEEKDRTIEERFADKSIDIEKLVAVKMQIAALHEALNKLNPEEREIIQALFFEEIPQRDLAKKLNISQGAVFRRKEKTLKKLKEFLIDWE